MGVQEVEVPTLKRVVTPPRLTLAGKMTSGEAKRKMPRMSLKPNGGGGSAGGGGGGGTAAAGGEGEEVDATSQSETRARNLGYNPARIPSWCDRVLWRSYPECPCELSFYRSETRVDTSDHAPVCAAFEVRVMLPGEYEKGSGDRHEWCARRLCSHPAPHPLAVLVPPSEPPFEPTSEPTSEPERGCAREAPRERSDPPHVCRQGSEGGDTRGRDPSLEPRRGGRERRQVCAARAHGRVLRRLHTRGVHNAAPQRSAAP